MPFGLRNAGDTFMRAMKTILRPVRAFADTYVDDMSVGSGQWSQHMCHAKQYLQVNQPFGESTMRWRRGEEEKIHMQLLISCNAIFMHRMKSQIHIQRIVACG